MRDLYGVIGSKSYANLLADPQGADVIAIPVEPGNGSLPAGRLMYRKSNGLYAPAASGQISTSYMLVVLKEGVETGSAVAPGGFAEDAAAYRAGCFIQGAVTLSDGSAPTAAHKVVLNLMGIRFDVKEGTGTFDNSTVTITYKGNNGADEDDYLVGEITGATHTVLANTVTDFTAPDGKSFSKWNTTADGTGTDYAAAGSYTASADLTLYAVWAS